MKLKRKNLMRYTKKTSNTSFEDSVLKKLNDIKGSRVLIAFSGGKDSLALLDLVCKNADALQFYVVACHVNHGVRAEADDDEQFCKQFANDNNIEFVSVNIKNELLDSKDSFEAIARKFRYKALQSVASDYKLDYILTAHTFDDQLESFIIDLFTGSSIYTMQGIASNYSNIYRAMLGVTTEQVENYINCNNLCPAYDKSNDDTKYVRNNVRKNVLPVLIDNGGEAFVNSVLRLQTESAKLQTYMFEKTNDVVIESSQDYILIDRAKFLSLHELEQEFLLGSIFSDKFRFTKKNVYEAIDVVKGKTSKRIDMPSSYKFESSYNSIRLFKKCLIQIFLVEKEIGIDNIVLHDAKVKFYKDKLLYKLIVRNRRSGDVFDGKKLKDLYINNKVELFDRDRAIIVEQNDKIIWAEYISKEGDISVERVVK